MCTSNGASVASRNRKFGCASEGTGAEKEVGVGMSRFVFNKMGCIFRKN